MFSFHRPRPSQSQLFQGPSDCSRSDRAKSNPLHRVVIIGAGFGGLAAANTLASRGIDVTLVDQRNYHTFQPLLYEVATAGLDSADVAYPVRAIIGRDRSTRFRLGSVTGVDWHEQTVCFAASGEHEASSDGCADDIPFDSLIVASGVVVNFFNVPGAETFAHPLYTVDDASHLRDHILRRLEEADGESRHISDGTLNFIVVGGGPTGVEVSGAIAELLDMSVEHDGFLFDRTLARVVIIDSLDHLLAPFKPSAQRYAERTLRNRSVEVMLGRRVANVSPTEVEMDDGTVIPTRTVIWAGGITARGTVASQLAAPADPGGRLVVDSTLMVRGHENVYAVGDAAAIPIAPGSEHICPQLAQVAIQSGCHAADQIIAHIDGESLEPFVYRDKGFMATIGRRAAIAQLRGGFVLQGTLGWVAWFGLHLVYLVGFRNKVTVLVNWSWRYLNWTSGPRIIARGQPGELGSEMTDHKIFATQSVK
jgi:NADH dehydrogenase